MGDEDWVVRVAFVDGSCSAGDDGDVCVQVVQQDRVRDKRAKCVVEGGKGRKGPPESGGGAAGEAQGNLVLAKSFNEKKRYIPHMGPDVRQAPPTHTHTQHPRHRSSQQQQQ